jgi:hypothetical protein
MGKILDDDEVRKLLEAAGKPRELSKMRADVHDLIYLIIRFIKDPSKEASLTCRKTIGEIEAAGNIDANLKVFLRSVYTAVTRPYLNAPMDLADAIRKYRRAIEDEQR